jgi:hypothetical protein
MDEEIAAKLDGLTFRDFINVLKKSEKANDVGAAVEAEQYMTHIMKAKGYSEAEIEKLPIVDVFYSIFPINPFMASQIFMAYEIVIFPYN